VSGSAIIDTNVIIKMLNGNESAKRLFEKIERAFIPVTVVGELFYGAYKSSRQQENMELFEAVLEDFELLPIDAATARSYALIKADLQICGFTIPENDLWIAAAAHANRCSLATFDAHFKHISQIEIIAPK
jgi:tRNA(fMet)-specific endonuclease VapC